MILLISTNKEKLHELEFVKPAEKILDNFKIKYFSKHYSDLNKKDLQKADKIIICGTSLKDNQFLEDLEKFDWIKNYSKSILGICSGIQIISLIFSAKLKKETEIGLQEESLEKEFLGVKGKLKSYYLHNNYTTLPKEFIKYNSSKIPKAIKHKTKEIYGVLFHPEVNNPEIIERFVKS